jgi:hypothetical protein
LQVQEQVQVLAVDLEEQVVVQVGADLVAVVVQELVEVV